MRPLDRRVALWLPLALGIGAVAALGGLWPSDPAPALEGIVRHTIDRGGTIRWANGKADVDSLYRLSIDRGPEQVPLTIGAWQGFDFPQGDVSLLTADSIFPEVMINRLYRAPDGGEVAFALVGSNTTRKLHRPEICYVAAGWGVQDLPLRTVRLEQGEIVINQFRARAPIGEERVVAYAFVWQDARRRIEDGAFIMQVGSPIRPGETDEAAGARVDRFIRQLFPRAAPPPALLALGG